MAVWSSFTQRIETPWNRPKPRLPFQKDVLDQLLGVDHHYVISKIIFTILSVSLAPALPLGPWHGNRIVPPWHNQHTDHLLNSIHDKITTHFLLTPKMVIFGTAMRLFYSSWRLVILPLLLHDVLPALWESGHGGYTTETSPWWASDPGIV